MHRHVRLFGVRRNEASLGRRHHSSIHQSSFHHPFKSFPIPFDLVPPWPVVILPRRKKRRKKSKNNTFPSSTRSSSKERFDQKAKSQKQNATTAKGQKVKTEENIRPELSGTWPSL